MPRCPDYDGLQGFDFVTGALSHEMIETSVDPFPIVDPAYRQTDSAHSHWIRAMGGGEPADLCARDREAFTTFDDLPYVVQRSWSNQAATAGHDPCQPTKPGEAYFQATPVLSDTVLFNLGGYTKSVKGVTIPVGESRTIDVQLFSDAPTDGPFDVFAFDLGAQDGGAPLLDFTWDATKGRNGQTLHLTIAVNAAGEKKTELFYVVTELGGQQNLWAGIVGQ